MTIIPITIDHYDSLISLWKRIEGLGLSSADERPAMRTYLERNPGLSLSAWEDDRLIGTILCGHDGRRGYIHHLAVDQDYRRSGIGNMLVDRALSSLKKLGIQKCHLFMFENNEIGRQFWKDAGWTERTDLTIFSRDIG